MFAYKCEKVYVLFYTVQIKKLQLYHKYKNKTTVSVLFLPQTFNTC